MLLRSVILQEKEKTNKESKAILKAEQKKLSHIVI